jgi:hypothetical protein
LLFNYVLISELINYSKSLDIRVQSRVITRLSRRSGSAEEQPGRSQSEGLTRPNERINNELPPCTAQTLLLHNISVDLCFPFDIFSSIPPFFRYFTPSINPPAPFFD